MEEALRRAIHDVTLRARDALMTEARELLEGTYGLDGNGNLAPADRLPALRDEPELQETRRRLERFLEDEAKAGLKGQEAVEKLIKEVAFTHLNRFVAFKMMEARKLIRGTLDRLYESNAFKFYLADPAHADDLARYEAGDQPQNALGEGPRDIAYRRFLLWQCGQVAQEIKVLFDPDNLPSRLFPRPRALREVLALLNDDALTSAWDEDETIGWVYQYFNEPDVEAFKEEKSAKVPSHLIAPKTQQFTPRWIVRFLVENTLGRLWVQMHPDTWLKDRMTYLVPLAEEIPSEPLKPVREITILDPATGTMHFGLVAFDLLVEMYREELEKAGQPGWPNVPSVSSEDEISTAILANNLFGIDIDLRAVQLSALTLYLKAKTLNRNARIAAINLACTDVLPLNSDRLEAFLKKMALTRPVYSRIIRSLWARLEDAGQLGSLLRLEQDIRSLIETERRAVARERQTLPGVRDEARFADALNSDEDFWEVLEGQITQAFDEFARQEASRGVDTSFFVGEAVKGLRILDLMMRRYDVVVTNPPYVDSRDYNARLKSFMEKAYPASKRNTYSAFLERCVEFLTDSGRLGIITPQTFMFISAFEKTRAILREHVAIETLAHTGLNTFSDAVVDAAFYVLRREGETQRCDDAIGTYFRLLKERDPEAKRLGFERAVGRLRDGKPDPAVYRYRQGDFDTIPGSPWVYWITPGLRRLFDKLSKLGENAQPHCGMTTSDNFRFLRFWWEVGRDQIGFRCANAEAAKASKKRWFPYMKGGSFRRWFGNQAHVVNWWNDGIEIQAAPSFPRAQQHYFRRGVTWTELTSGRFSARLSPGGFIFDVSGSSAFPDDIPLVLAVMNSAFAQHILKLINPTVHVQVGDLARLPIPTTSSSILTMLVEQAIALAKADSEEDETTYDFIAPPAWTTGLKDVAARAARLAEIERQIDEEVYRLYEISDEDRAAIEAELTEITTISEDDENHKQSEEPEETTELEAAMTREELALRWISYAVGIVLGRFEPGMEGRLGCAIVVENGVKWHLFPPEVEARLRALAKADGLAVLDKGHPDDLVARVEQALTLMLGEEQTADVISAIGGDPVQIEESFRRFLDRDFFTKEHVKRYRKRPVYWLLQSPKKSYGLYLFHERLTRDTLFVLQRQHVDPKIKQVGLAINELRQRRDALQGREKRRVERELEKMEALHLELEEFARRLKAITDRGYNPHIDDGVILNMAPLYEIIPSWSAEPKKHWEALEEGEYDWAHLAMHYWPDRVLAKCRTDKSLAIAHGRLDLYEGDGA